MNDTRLRDQVDSSDADVGVAAALVASATRLLPSEARKQRVRAALDAHGRRRPMPKRMRAALVLATVVATSAAFAHVLPKLAHVLSRRPQPPAAPSHAPKSATRPAAPPVVEPIEALAPEAPPEPAPPKPRRHPVVAAPPPAKSEDEAASLLVAVQALRRDHDPALGLARLDAYFARFPNGSLHEEALGLGIEAASALGDARAADYASRYLEQHPDGRFKAAAQRAQKRFGSKEESP
jgi:hypothetical protein